MNRPAVRAVCVSLLLGAALSFLFTGAIGNAIGWPWAIGLAALGPAGAALLVLIALGRQPP